MAASELLLLDFDHTLFDTDRFFWVDVRAAMLGLGVDARLWEETYQTVWPGGYSIERHVEALAARASWPPPRHLLDAFDAASADLQRYLFPDVLPFLRAARRAGRRVVVISFGDPAWQTFKLTESGLATLLDEVHTARAVGGKSGLAAALAGTGPAAAGVIAVDNNPLELDAMRDRCPALQTYRMDRVPPDHPGEGEAAYRFREARTYAGLSARHSHRACRSLDEVAL